ncbi:uncharacterized protein At3g06530 isoform X1 [Vigna radiata var. radiata]|uniref:Uncharacterized protein At3g06530 isoform X1 n=1 Tax=Vigna radiata var. radiata TaxID=3916 RepID=A0A1S3UEW6_VIGRR|nr:uncharacterized protein At3g06530 isoform X1 [Vigna radiata var. radiata]
MATSLASQLETLRSFAKADSEPLKRPFTRPSILFDPKEAADIDIETLFSLALEGLEVLIGKDERFRNYKNDLFSHRSKELDRELLGIEQNNQLNVSIASYLRLLSGYFLLRPALKTLEYLIRRHKIHVYNIEDLILCSLPYHDTHPFVRVVQILDTRNTKWGFLDGVKASGAPPPRMVIVQQCIRDKGILDALCNYASPSKKSQPSRLFIGFCTAVFVEVLGTVVTVDDDLVKRILPFVVSGLQPGINGFSDHKAGSLMIIGLLGNKAALAPKLLNSLIRSVAEVARGEAIQMTDIYWFRLSLITLINLVQSQNVEILPTKALEVLNKIRDLAGVLLELSKEFNIEKFLRVLLDSLIDCSSDEYCQQTLLSLIEIIPINSFVDHVVTTILSTCVKLSQKVGDSTPSMSAGWAKKILIIFNTKYPSELRGAVHHFLQENKARSKKDDSLYKVLCKLLDGNLDSALDISHSKVWFGLYHPKADVRRATLLDLDYSVIPETNDGSKNLINVQEAILRLLDDTELTVVQAALRVDGLPNVIDSSKLLDALLNVLRRCMDKLLSGSADSDSLNGEVAVTCLKKAISYFGDHTSYLKNIAAMIFPLLIFLIQTQSLNVKAVGLVNKINWPLYKNIFMASSGEEALIPGSLSSINLKIVNKMAENFLVHPEDHVNWFVECCSDLELSKTLFFFVLLQSLCIKPKDEDIYALFECLFPFLKAEWETSVAADVVLDEFNSEMLEWECKDFLKDILYANLRPINVKVMICIFWRLLELLLSVAPSDILLRDGDEWVSKIRNLFVFFASSKLKHAFRKHLHHLAVQCRISPSCLLSKFFTEEGVSAAVQVESLQCYAFLCSLEPDRWKLGLLAEFPSVLVPLASDTHNIRVAAMDCIDSLYTLWCHFEHAGKKNGNNASWFHFVGELLSLMSQLKTFILSDKKFLPSLFASTLSSSFTNNLEHQNILVPQNVEKRFDQPTKIRIIGFILGSTLKLSNYGKLMILSLFKGIGNALMHVPEVGSLLFTFLMQYYEKLSLSCPKLSDNEIKITCLLLESCVMSCPSGGNDLQDLLVKALRFGSLNSDDPACVKPCIAVLNKLNSKFYVELKNEVKEHLFCELVFLWRNGNGDVQRATKEALTRIDISFSTVGYMLDLILALKSFIVSSSNEKAVKKQKLVGHQEAEDPSNNIWILSSLLDVLLLKKDITNRHLLLGSLFKLLSKVFSEECVNKSFIPVQRLSQKSSPSEANNSTIYHIQQTLLIILEDIIISLKSIASLNENIKSEINIKLLIECAQNSEVITRNHIFSVLSAITRVYPEEIFEYMHDILVVIGEAAVTQIDDHSRIVFEDLISAIVPCWLSKTDDVEKLLKIFMEIFPEIVEHRRLSFVLYLLRTLGEGKSLASLLILLFRSLISKKASCFLNAETADDLTFYTKEWEYRFAVQICEQFTSKIWLPSLVMLLEQRVNRDVDQTQLLELFIVMQFSLQKLQDPEFVFKLESREDAAVIQRALGELMEQVVLLLQLVDARKKQLNIPVIVRNELKETMRAVIRILAGVMIPYVYINSITKLLHNADKNVGKKALGLLCEAARSHKNVSLRLKDNKGSRSTPTSLLLHMNETSPESLKKLCVEIIRVLDDSSDTSLKVAAVSALEVVAEIFPSNNSIFSLCLQSVTRYIASHNLAVTSSCLRATAALINVLGPKALAELPKIMDGVMKSSSRVLSNLNMKPKSSDVLSASMESYFYLLITLEAVVDKLGGFLNPYLVNIMEILVLYPEHISGMHAKVESRAHGVRKLLAERIPVRLALPPLLKLYPAAIKAGDKSLTIVFDMLGIIIGTMDRSSIVAFHGKVFELCLVALDLRRQSPPSIENIDLVEKGVLNTLTVLTLKLTESMFKPLLIKSIEWVESEVDGTSCTGSIDRAISFYGMVNKLTENHRSLFVPYFKHLLGGCVHHLSDDGDVKVSTGNQKKRAKILDDGIIKETGSVSIKVWHLRALVLSSLHKCFLYDTGTLKFLDSSNFQMLLRPIVSQLVIDPPTLLDDSMNIPSVKDVDDLVVSCIGQMAVTAGSDLLWKPLNHEVLMQTRSDKMRAKMLGLRIVKYFVENLKEEYLVLLAETIPFLGELLEDVEISVKSLAQDILQEMESLSGESLRQYL